MPPKRKQDKKVEETVNIDSLPPANTWISVVLIHPFLSTLVKFFKPIQQRLISIQDLEQSLRESNQQLSSESLASTLKQKLDQLEYPIRKDKTKTESSRGDLAVTPQISQQKPELLLFLRDYPASRQDLQNLYSRNIQISQCIFLQPNQTYYTNKVVQKQQIQYDQQTEPPVIPDFYLETFCLIQDISRNRSPIKSSKDIFWKIFTVEIDQDLEFKQEVKQEIKEEPKQKKEQKGKKKEEESKQELIDPNDSKILLMQQVINEATTVCDQYYNYTNWIRTIKPKPLYPDPQRHGISQDDLPKQWDFRLFHKVSGQFPQKIITCELLLSAMLMQICQSPSLFSIQKEKLSFFFDSKIQWIVSNQLESVDQIKIPQEKPEIGLGQSMRIYNFHDLISQDSDILRIDRHGILIKDAQLGVTLNFPFKGVKKYELPSWPLSSQASSGAYLTEVSSFSSLSKPEFDRALTVHDIEQILLKKQPQRKWDCSDRKYEEKHSVQTFMQILQKQLVFEPDLITEYNSVRDCMYLVVFHKTIPGRILRKQWTAPNKVIPPFLQFSQQIQTSADFYDIPPQNVGKIQSRTKIMYPSDNSVIKMTRYQIGISIPEQRDQVTSQKSSVTIFKDNLFFGIRKGVKNTGQFWSQDQQEKISVQMSEKGAVLNIILADLHVKLSPDGKIYQKKFSSSECRVNCQMGYIFKYNQNLQILNPNSETAIRTKDKTWTIVNSSGKRLMKRQQDGAVFQKEPMQTKTTTDPQTLTEVTIREDHVLLVRHLDNSVSVFHKDAQVHTSADKNTVFVQADGYAHIKYRKDPVKARQQTVIGIGSSDSGLGAQDIMLRSYDGILTEVLLPNQTKVKIILQKQQAEGFQNFTDNIIYLVEKADLTVYKIAQDGEVVLVTGESRHKLEEMNGENAYFYELFTIPEERSSGVYTAECQEGKIWTHDSEGNHFVVTKNGKATEKLAVSLNADQDIPSPEITDGEYIDQECRFLPPPSTILQPRIFILKNDNSITELLNDQQLKQFARKGLKKYSKEVDQKVYHTWIYGLKSEKKVKFQDSPFEIYLLPNFLNSLQHTINFDTEPLPTAYVYRKILEHSEYTPEQKQEFLKGLKDYQDWKIQQKKNREKLIIKQPQSDESKEIQIELQLALLELRGDNEKYEALKKQTIVEEEEVEEESSESEIFEVELLSDEDGPLTIEIDIKQSQKSIISELKQETPV